MNFENAEVSLGPRRNFSFSNLLRRLLYRYQLLAGHKKSEIPSSMFNVNNYSA